MSHLSHEQTCPNIVLQTKHQRQIWDTEEIERYSRNPTFEPPTRRLSLFKTTLELNLLGMHPPGSNGTNWERLRRAPADSATSIVRESQLEPFKGSAVSSATMGPDGSDTSSTASTATAGNLRSGEGRRHPGRSGRCKRVNLTTVGSMLLSQMIGSILSKG